MIDISMQYLGMKLSGPIVVASTPLSESIDNVRHMEDAGASAIVLTSLFEEQLALESRTRFSARPERLPHDARDLS
jgi:dihydroorotate dehydrogenase (fumarate)